MAVTQRKRFARARSAAVTLGIFAAAGALGAPARAQEPDDVGSGRPVVELTPSLIELGGAPAAVEIRLRNAPAITAFRIEIAYDGAAALVTAAEPGAYLATAAGPGRLALRGVEPGRIAITGESGEALATPTPEGAVDEGVEGADDPSTFVDGADPEALTEGPLAIVTFAALARTDDPREITIVVELTDAAGSAVEADAPSAQIFVRDDPSPEARAQAELQAAALADEAVGGIAGLQDTILRSYRRLGQRSADFEVGPELAWVTILVMALGVVWLGWHFGRRPV